MTDIHRSDDGTWTAQTGQLRLRWCGASEARVDRAGRLSLQLAVPRGEQHDLVLEISDTVLPERPDPDAAWVATRAGRGGRRPASAATAGG
jgi:hypothetical protein